MDQILNNKWLLVGVVVGALVLAVGLTFYFRASKPSTALAQHQQEQPTQEEQQPSDAESEDESADQDTEESRSPENEQQPAVAGPA